MSKRNYNVRVRISGLAESEAFKLVQFVRRLKNDGTRDITLEESGVPTETTIKPEDLPF